jgi:prepilin-type N-terminal cleavage/methylation domain-containing protein
VIRPRPQCVRPGSAFTLIELLVVIAIIALLVGILLPSLQTARMLAKIVTAHAELRGVTTALSVYREEHKALPPTRFSCSSQVAYELPCELADGGYLPAAEINGVTVARVRDVFHEDASYRYRAVGDAIQNETTLVENGATLWVPDGWPGDEQDTGKYHDDPEVSPVRYAVWSWGPKPDAPLFDIPGRVPVPDRYWLTSPRGSGVVTHIETRDRQVVMSP